jgi:prolyl oligopeptidase
VQISANSFSPQRPLAQTKNIAPKTEVRPVTDHYHGQEVVDKFRWLENGESEETKAWTKAQNDHTDANLHTIPERAAVVNRLTELFSGKNADHPYKVGDREFVFKRNPGQNQAALYMKDATSGEFKPVLDPNSWSKDGTEALDWSYHSPKGNLLVYGRSSGGDEWSRLHILDLTTGTEREEIIPRTRAASLAWEPDESGFYYTKYPTPGEVPAGEEDYHRHVFHHKLGEDPKNDPKIFGEGLPREAWTSVSLSPDGEKLLFTVSQGWTRDDLFLQDVKTGERTTLIEGTDAKSSAEFVDKGAKLQVLTTLDAPRKRLLEIDLAKPQQDHWVELLPQDKEATLEDVTRVDGKLYANYLRNAHSEVAIYNTAQDGGLTEAGKVELPGIGSVSGLHKTADGKISFSYGSYNFPNATLELEPGTTKPTVKNQDQVPFDFENFDVKQEWFRSVDGTKVPMFIVHKKGLEPNGDTPTLLYGYGGFDVNMTPGFSKSTAHWLEQGGIYAVANLRGGGEFGAEWHEAGTFEKKQNVFDDFISAGQHLITAGYTNRDKLAVAGGSNGGLLTGAAVTQAPELFEAAIVQVPLLDMVRYDEFGIAKLWRAEYGSASDKGQFDYINAYSPYQNVTSKLERLGVPYPATFLMAGEKDSRTDPLHARKFAAELQRAQGNDQAENPILLRIEANAGHGAGKPVGKVVEAEADKWIFLQQELGMLSDSRPA